MNKIYTIYESVTSFDYGIFEHQKFSFCFEERALEVLNHFCKRVVIKHRNSSGVVISRSVSYHRKDKLDWDGNPIVWEIRELLVDCTKIGEDLSNYLK